MVKIPDPLAGAVVAPAGRSGGRLMAERKPPIAGLDHVLVGVRDLEQAREIWTRLGFTLTPRGRHIGWGTANYCIMFDRDYIELLGIIDPAQFTNNLDRFLAKREGLLGLAFATDDAARSARTLRARGIEVEGPKNLSRILELPTGEVEPAFELVHLKPEDSPGFNAFLCHHRTPDVVWQSQWVEHPNTAVGIGSVHVVVKDPKTILAAYHRLLDRDIEVPVGETFTFFDVGGCSIYLSAPRPRSASDQTSERLPTPPYIEGLTLLTADLESLQARLIASGTAFDRTDGDNLEVPYFEANGVRLHFTRAQRPVQGRSAEVIHLNTFRRSSR